jgi:hypothetical protein
MRWWIVQHAQHKSQSSQSRPGCPKKNTKAHKQTAVRIVHIRGHGRAGRLCWGRIASIGPPPRAHTPVCFIPHDPCQSRQLLPQLLPQSSIFVWCLAIDPLAGIPPAGIRCSFLCDAGGMTSSCRGFSPRVALSVWAAWPSTVGSSKMSFSSSSRFANASPSTAAPLSPRALWLRSSHCSPVFSCGCGVRKVLLRTVLL